MTKESPHNNVTTKTTDNPVPQANLGVAATGNRAEVLNQELLSPASPSHVAVIVAMGLGREIGLGNDIPWRIPGEQRRFKSLTMGEYVVMGRRTYESIPRGLPGRHVLVLSHNPLFAAIGDVRHVRSSTEALEAVPADRTLFVAGGAMVYAVFLPICDILYLTIVQAHFRADTFFPEVNLQEYELAESNAVDASVPYEYQMWRRKVYKR